MAKIIYFLIISSTAVVLFLPLFYAKAAVVINEVAWMGTAVSANNEWLELYNGGDSEVDLSGWTLKAADGSPEIYFSGAAVKTIPAGGFYLLERTDDSTAPEVKADAIYTGALSNDGEILILKDNNGMEVDRVDAGNKWLAGDNSTKQTMQRVSGGAWITAGATPKTANASGGQSSQVSFADPVASQEAISFSSQTSQSGSGAVAWPVEPQIYANAGGSKTGVAGAGILFEGAALGIKKEPLENARFLWNFGDGSFAEGKNVRHFYKYPGEYIAVLDVVSGQYSASDRAIVKIVPNKLEIVEAGENFIKLKNGSETEIDVSGWFVKANQNIFTFPANSFIGSGAAMVLSSDVSKIKFSENDTKVDLLYPNGSAAFSYQNKKETKPQPTMPVAAISSSSQANKIAQIIQPAKKSEPTTVVGSGATTTQLASVIYLSEENEGGKNYKKWLYLALFLGLFSGGSLIFVRRHGSA